MPDNPAAADPMKKPRRRWFQPAPDRFVVGLLVTVCLLWLSERLQWFGFNHHKGWTVLIAVGSVGGAGIFMLLWWVASLLFHWRFQFGIRSLLAFAVVCSIACSWLGVEMKQARRQAQAVEWLMGFHERAWQTAYYDWEGRVYDGRPSDAEPPEAMWLLKTLGLDFFSRVVEVDLAGDPVTDADLEKLKALPQIWKLDLGDTEITDVGLTHVEGLTQLESLSLVGTPITDAGLGHLKSLTQLTSLYLINTEITDAGLEDIEGLPQLEYLDLSGTKITDAGLHHLAGMAQLTELYLNNTAVTGPGVQKLQTALPNCEIRH